MMEQLISQATFRHFQEFYLSFFPPLYLFFSLKAERFSLCCSRAGNLWGRAGGSVLQQPRLVSDRTSPSSMNKSELCFPSPLGMLKKPLPALRQEFCLIHASGDFTQQTISQSHQAEESNMKGMTPSPQGAGRLQMMESTRSLCPGPSCHLTHQHI